MKSDKVLKFLILIAIAVFLYFQYGKFLDKFSPKPKKIDKVGWSKYFNTSKDVYDLVVYGSDIEGITSAITASKLGAKVMLLSDKKYIVPSDIDSLNVNLDFEISKNKTLNGGFSEVLFRKFGKKLILDEYVKYLNKLISEYKIDVGYKAEIAEVSINDDKLGSVEFNINGKSRRIISKRFVDASRDGDLLIECKVKKSMGFEDINLKDTYLPMKINFVVDNFNIDTQNKEVKNTDFYAVLDKYTPNKKFIQLKNFDSIYQGSKKAIITGLRISDFDIKKSEQLMKLCTEEVFSLSKFLNLNFETFRNTKILKIANNPIFKSKNHFESMYTLSVMDILNNTNFKDKVAVSSSSIVFAVDGNEFTVAKPILYSVPYRSMLPKGVDNLLMIGEKAGYSALASTSAGNIGTVIETSEVSTIIALYSIVKDLSLNEMAIYYQQNTSEFDEVFKDFNLNLEQCSNTSNLDDSIKRLCQLGLVFGGADLEFHLKSKAKESEFAILILNGIYRNKNELYNYEFDLSLRSYLNKNEITSEKIIEIICAIYNIEYTNESKKVLIEKGIINDKINEILNSGQYIINGDMYYIVDYIIQNYSKI